MFCLHSLLDLTVCESRSSNWNRYIHRKEKEKKRAVTTHSVHSPVGIRGKGWGEQEIKENRKQSMMDRMALDYVRIRNEIVWKRVQVDREKDRLRRFYNESRIQVDLVPAPTCLQNASPWMRRVNFVCSDMVNLEKLFLLYAESFLVFPDDPFPTMLISFDSVFLMSSLPANEITSKCFSFFDNVKRGYFTIFEFMHLFATLHSLHLNEKIPVAFCSLDTCNVGSIGEEEIAQLLSVTAKDSNFVLTPKLFRQMVANTMNAGNVNKSGRLEYKDFVDLVNVPTNQAFLKRFFTVDLMRIYKRHTRIASE